eukprot:6212488-Pleurochrysis_carterae.AAC.1
MAMYVDCKIYGLYSPNGSADANMQQAATLYHRGERCMSREQSYKRASHLIHVSEATDWLHANEGQRKNYTIRLPNNLMCDALTAQNTSNDLGMPCQAILHAPRSAEETVTARSTGQAISKCH